MLIQAVLTQKNKKTKSETKTSLFKQAKVSKDYALTLHNRNFHVLLSLRNNNKKQNV